MQRKLKKPYNTWNVKKKHCIIFGNLTLIESSTIEIESF